MNSNVYYRVSAVVGFLAVALGAFGAHGLKEVLLRNDAVAVWQTGALYHLVHAVVLLLVAGRAPFARAAWWCFGCGTAVFSGSLYVLALTQLKWLGMITPLGGTLLLAGWVLLALRREHTA